MKKLSGKMCAVIAACMSISIGFVVPAAAEPTESGGVDIVQISPGVVDIVQIGDSYSAGNGAGMYEFNNSTERCKDYSGENGCYRSTRNWGHNYRRWLSDQGIPVRYFNKAVSGATTQNVLDWQIADVNSTHDVVLMTIGGNDVDFAGIVESCFGKSVDRESFAILSSTVTRGVIPTDIAGDLYTHFRQEFDGCKNGISSARASLDTVGEKTKQIFDELAKKLEPGAQIVLVGYPYLSTDDPYVLDKWDGQYLNSHEYYYASGMIRVLGIEAIKMQRKIVDEWNTANAATGIDVSYVDTVSNGDTSYSFEGHEPDPDLVHANPERWINELFETEGKYNPGTGKVEASLTIDIMNYYHPNITGHEMIAKAVEDQFGLPAKALSESKITGIAAGNDIDIVFAIDATGSMRDDIDDVRVKVNQIAQEINDKANTHRFALVTYKDNPAHGGDSDDYPSRLELGFTSDIEEFKTKLDNIEAYGGGDDPETVWSGVMEGLKLDWRDGVKKMLIVLGDAPAKTPEPVTNYTPEQLAKIAFEIDPVEVYAISSGELGDDAMATLTSLSGGEIYNASQEETVTDLISKAINTTLNKPSAWLQGPIAGYVGQPVTYDARGSYTLSEPIVTYEWDFDGDGTYDLTGSEPLAEHTFDSEFEGFVSVRITTRDGLVAVATTHASVTPEPDKAVVDQLEETNYEVEKDNNITVLTGAEAQKIISQMDPDTGYLKIDNVQSQDTSDLNSSDVDINKKSDKETQDEGQILSDENKPDPSQKQQSSDQKKLVKTGSSSVVVGISSLLLIAIGISIIVVLRRRFVRLGS